MQAATPNDINAITSIVKDLLRALLRTANAT
jgi:hypothetical protein